MKRKRFISFIISLVLIITLSITVFAQTRHYVYVRDKYGTLMSGATVQFIDDLGTVYTGVTNSSVVYLEVSNQVENMELMFIKLIMRVNFRHSRITLF